MCMVLSGLFTKTHFADCWSFNPFCNLVELCKIRRPYKQSCNNILLHVHLEGNSPAHPAPPMSYTYFIISVTTLGAADCTALFNHITFCTPLILDGATSRVDELLTLTPHVAPQLFYAEYLLIPLVR
jgi:hypothetical protein